MTSCIKVLMTFENIHLGQIQTHPGLKVKLTGVIALCSTQFNFNDVDE